MKLLGWKDDGSALPGLAERTPRAGLMEEDPDRFRRLIDSLTEGTGSLREWRESLRTGGAAVVMTGQQPALLGGPLYTLYKALTAVEAARRMRESGRPAIAAFWCVGDDTDHDEVAFASWPRRGAPPRRVRDEVSSAGARIGDLPLDRFRGASAQLIEDWPRIATWDPLRRITSPDGPATWAGFLKEALALLAGGEPLLFVDGNGAETIAASQAWLRRFVPERAGIAREIEALAAAAARSGIPAPLSGEEALRSLFVVDGEGRRALAEREVPDPSLDLLPNVVLRPALQEHLLPVACVVCGDAEISYRRLLGPVYARAGRDAAPLMRRFAATLFPPSWSAGGAAPDPIATMEGPDTALEAWAQKAIDEGLLSELDTLRGDLRDRFLALGARLAVLDRSLAQVVDSSAGKIDYQVSRIEEAARSKARASLYRKDPDLANLREFLLPRGKAQERSFTLWTPILWEGMHALDDLRQVIHAWFDRGERGHALLALEEEGRP
jgi:bacillithiol synthase